MALSDCPPSFKIVKLGDLDAERNAINAGFQAILRCMAERGIPDPTGHSGEFLSTDGTDVFWASISGSGTVTSVAVSTGSSGVAVSGSPVTTSGTIDLDLGTMASVDDAPSDGTTYGRKNGAWTATGGGATDGAITVNIGSAPEPGKAIITTMSIPIIVPADYNLTGWEIYAYPAATVSVDVRYETFPTLPDVSDSITNSNPLTTTAALSNTGTTAGWTSTNITRGNWLYLVITANDLATFISIQLQGDKS